MFLAVCFRETDDDMLDQFEEEVSKRGEMTEAKQEMFSQLKAKTKDKLKEESNEAEGACAAPAQRESRSVSAPWWNIEEDRASEKRAGYCYDIQTDTWKVNLAGFGTVRLKEVKKGKRKCVVM